MRIAAKPTAVRISDPPKAGRFSEANIGERELEALAVPLTHGGQASPDVRWAVDGHDPDVGSGDGRDLSDDECFFGSGQESGQLLFIVVTVESSHRSACRVQRD